MHSCFTYMSAFGDDADVDIGALAGMDILGVSRYLDEFESGLRAKCEAGFVNSSY